MKMTLTTALLLTVAFASAQPVRLALDWVPNTTIPASS